MESDPLPIQKVDPSQADLQHLLKLRARKPARSVRLPRPTKGDRVADVVTSTVGSWRFIIIQSCLLALWIVLQQFSNE